MANEELAFADQVGRHFARQYALPPMVGRVLGWLMVCEPRQQTAAELAVALQASRTAIGAAVAILETLVFVQRSRTAGERADRITLHPEIWEHSLESSADRSAFHAMAGVGLKALGDAPAARRARLMELAAYADFLDERLPALAEEWRVHRDALRASGELPADSPG